MNGHFGIENFSLFSKPTLACDGDRECFITNYEQIIDDEIRLRWMFRFPLKLERQVVKMVMMATWYIEFIKMKILLINFSDDSHHGNHLPSRHQSSLRQSSEQKIDES